MIKALCKAYAGLGEEDYLQLAETNIRFLEENLSDGTGSLFYHSWNKSRSSQQAFLDDYGALVQSYILLYEVTANTEYLLKAKLATEKVIMDFSDGENKLFYYTGRQQRDLLLRKKEIYDGATPSGNALMAGNLYLLSVYFNDPDWKRRAEEMLLFIKDMAEKYPTSFGCWGLNLQMYVNGIKEIVIVGIGFKEFLRQVLKEYIPLRLVQAAPAENDAWSLLKGKAVATSETKIFICENYQCLQPAENFEQFKNQLQNIF
jgi:uncharacterized protein YyaL (SSP411 family)